MRKLMLTCVLLLLLTNIVVLAGVAYNRSGEPLHSIELTERELPIRQFFNSNEENSGTTLSFKWQVLDKDEDQQYMSTTYGTPTWLDDEKLTALGFDMKKFKNDKDKYRHRTSHLATEVILALEYQGENYDKAVMLAEEKAEVLRQQVAEDPDDEDQLNEFSRYEEQLTRLKVSRTRLYVVDAGLDKQALMQKYAEQNNILLVRGEIGLHWNDNVVSGRIRQLYIQQVHAPLPLSEQLTTWTNGETYASYKNSSIAPHYKVRLNIGKRLEPWIESVSQMESENNKKGRRD
jgi:hypothetical protein